MKKWRRRIKYYLLRLLRQRSGSHTIALGFSIGFLPNLYPTFGFGPFISLFLARIFRGNPISALLGATMGAWLWPFFFYVNYKVGAWITHREVDLDRLVEENIEEVAEDVGGIGWNFMVGSVVNTIIIGIAFYALAFYLFGKYRGSLLAHIKSKM